MSVDELGAAWSVYPQPPDPTPEVPVLCPNVPMPALIAAVGYSSEAPRADFSREGDSGLDALLTQAVVTGETAQIDREFSEAEDAIGKCSGTRWGTGQYHHEASTPARAKRGESSLNFQDTTGDGYSPATYDLAIVREGNLVSVNRFVTGQLDSGKPNDVPTGEFDRILDLATAKLSAAGH